MIKSLELAEAVNVAAGFDFGSASTMQERSGHRGSKFIDAGGQPDAVYSSYGGNTVNSGVDAVKRRYAADGGSGIRGDGGGDGGGRERGAAGRMTRVVRFRHAGAQQLDHGWRSALCFAVGADGGLPWLEERLRFRASSSEGVMAEGGAAGGWSSSSSSSSSLGDDMDELLLGVSNPFEQSRGDNRGGQSRRSPWPAPQPLPPSAAAGTDIQQEASVLPRAQVGDPRAREKRIRKKSAETKKAAKKKVKKRKNVKAKNDAPPRRPAPTKKKTEKISSTDSREADSRSKKPLKIRHYAASIYKGVCGKSKTKWTWRCTFITTLSSAAHPFHYV